MNWKVKGFEPPPQPPDLCTKEFDDCKKCNQLGNTGSKELNIPKCVRFQSDHHNDSHCPRCGMSVGHGRHRCNVSMNHFEIA